MLKTPPRLAQDSRENPLPSPQWQSREAGSCLGAKQPNANVQFAADGGPADSDDRNVEEDIHACIASWQLNAPPVQTPYASTTARPAALANIPETASRAHSALSLPPTLDQAGREFRPPPLCFPYFGKPNANGFFATT